MIIRLLLTGFVLLVTIDSAVVGLPASAVRADQADSDFLYAAGFYQNKRWSYAADAFRDFLAAHPNHPRAVTARLYYGLSLNSLEKYQESREQLQLFVKADPESRFAADAWYRIGECSYYLNDFAGATAQLEKYLTDHPQHGLNQWARLLLGESLNRQNLFSRSEPVLKALLDSSPPASILPDATFAMAESLQGQKKIQDAVRLYQEVIEMKSDAFSHKSLYQIGRIYFDSGDFAKAGTIFDDVAADYPDKALAKSAAFQSAVCGFRLGQYEQAFAKFSEVPADAGTPGLTELWKGHCLREADRLSDARTVLATAFQQAAETDLAPEILFHRAQLEVLDQKKSLGAQMFTDLTDRWPQDRHVAESLFNAAELRMELNEIPAARRVLTRLQTDFPEAAKGPAATILEGRLLLQEGKPDQAIDVLQQISKLPAATLREQLLRNYHYIRALHAGQKFEEAVAAFEDLREEYAKPDASDFHGAVSLAAMSALELKQYAKARQFAELFLQVEQNSARHADALAVRAIACAQLKDFDTAQQDLRTLTSGFAQNPQTWMAVLQTAEAAWQQQDYVNSEQLFLMAVNRKEDARVHESALSGAAWSSYRRNDFAGARKLFGQLTSQYPSSTAAREAAFMMAMCSLDEGRKPEAAADFLKLYDSIEQQPEAVQSPDQVSYFLDSGRRYARLLSEAGQVDDADRMWERIAKTFARSEHLDEVLHEWAELNLSSERYERSDEICRRLLKEVPSSRYAGLARLSLAESEMSANRLDTALSEFTAIAAGDQYGEVEKEAALYHVIDIHAARREWPQVMQYGERFGTLFSASSRAPMIQLLYAEALLDQKQFAQATAVLQMLRTSVTSGTLEAEPWTERIWVVLAELALAEKRYADVDAAANELATRRPQSRFLFQVRDVQGRRWKNQAPPDFARAREYLTQVVQDENARGTETAARCQFLIGETLVMQENFDAAVGEYYRVYLSYPFDEWRARGLYQAAACEARLRKTDEAIRSYQDLVRDFPNSELAAMARERLKELGSAPKP
ncbi:MAG: tetratricopeptide repeat protein [Planctomycetaceae bacterium]